MVANTHCNWNISLKPYDLVTNPAHDRTSVRVHIIRRRHSLVMARRTKARYMISNLSSRIKTRRGVRTVYENFLPHSDVSKAFYHISTDFPNVNTATSVSGCKCAFVYLSIASSSLYTQADAGSEATISVDHDRPHGSMNSLTGVSGLSTRRWYRRFVNSQLRIVCTFIFTDFLIDLFLMYGA